MQNLRPERRPTVITLDLRARVLSATHRRPKDGSTIWWCRKPACKLRRYIRAHANTARAFRWKYSDVRRRIRP